MDRNALAGRIDHTLLSPAATQDEVADVCAEAIRHGMWSVCIAPRQVAFAAVRLADTQVRVCTVIGFPLGTSTSATKAYEATQAIADGADELDMVLDLGALRAGLDDVVEADIAAVVQAARGRCVKVILESAALRGDEIERACQRAARGGASFVKTSTGFGPGGATIDAVRRMRAIVGPDVGVKASGGIRDAQSALAMLEAGATRLGTSRSIEILDGLAR